VEANTAHEIVQACQLAEQYGCRLVIRGAVEGWTVASDMSRAKVSAIVTPRQRRSEDRRLNRPTGWSITNAANLYEYGVPIAIVPETPMITLWGIAGRDLLHLNMEAAFAVRGGLSNEAALQAITLGPARILGIDHRVGSIEPGKDADLIICDGDLLHYLTMVQYTIVNGRVVYDKAKETLFDHIRPDGDLDAPPPDDYWPRQLGANVTSSGLLTR
jgi:imidazolonepropionase-like amidohydrolase